jgi:hypothetical protein
VKLRFIVTLLTGIILSSNAFAYWFPARLHVVVLPGQVTAEIYNPYYETIICNGQLYGQTLYGGIMQVFFIEQLLPAGSNRFAFVQTTPINPFVSGWANINCRFIRF